MRLSAIIICILLPAMVWSADERFAPEVVKTLKQFREARAAGKPGAEQILLDHLKKKRSPAILFELGVVEARAKQTNSAADRFREVLKLDPDYPGVRRNLAFILVAQGKHRETVKLLQEEVKKGVIDTPIARVLGQCYMALGDPLAAETCLRTAIVADSSSRELRLMLAHVMHQQRKFRDAESVARSVLAVAPANTRAWRIVANSRMLDGRVDEAIDALEALTRFEPESDAATLAALGDLYLNEGMPMQARRVYQKASATGKLSARRLIALLNSLHSGGRDSEAAALAKSLLTRDDCKAAAHAVLGYIALDAGEDADAGKHLKACLKADPLNGRALIELGNLAASQDKTSEALAHYRSARALPKFEVHAIEAEMGLLLKTGEYNEAYKLIRELQRLSPSRSWDALLEEVAKLRE